MIWLIEAGGGEGALPTMACTGYLFQASGIWKGRDFISWRLWKVRDICRLGLLKDQKGLTGADRFEVIYLFLKHAALTAVERDVCCKLAIWKRVSFVSRT